MSINSIGFRYVRRMELRHLPTMVAIAEEGTFGRVASRLGYPQSSVSQQLAALEKAFGGAVFDRPGGPRPVRITPLDEVVLAHGRDLPAPATALADTLSALDAPDSDGSRDMATPHRAKPETVARLGVRAAVRATSRSPAVDRRTAGRRGASPSPDRPRPRIDRDARGVSDGWILPQDERADVRRLVG